MIKVEANKGITVLKIGGSTATIAAELLIIVAAVHNALKKENPELGDYIKGFIRKHVDGDALFDAEEDGEADD